jgi:transcriptional regulator with XRE-family HTH domain
VSQAAVERESGVYRRIVADIRRSGLSTSELAEIAGVGERQVQNWAAGSHAPRDRNRDLLLEIHYITERLAEIYTSEGIEVWLHGRNKLLDARRPIDLLRAGDFEVVVNEVERLARGGG